MHGGSGSSTSPYDYAFTRKWSDVYTVVTWDQRNCGKSYSSDQNDITLTYGLMMSDGVEMTKFLLDYLGRDKITLLGKTDYLKIDNVLKVYMYQCNKKIILCGNYLYLKNIIRKKEEIWKLITI